MKFDFGFKTIDSEKEIKTAINFIRDFPLGYEGYMDWTEKVYCQLMNGEKSGIVAMSEGKIIGDLIYQNLDKGILELKNLRVHSSLGRRGFSNFMMNQLEIESLISGKEGILLDTREDNMPIRNLLEFRGYDIISKEKLYDDKIDVSYFKKLK